MKLSNVLGSFMTLALPQEITAAPCANETAHAAALRELFREHNQALHFFLLSKLRGDAHEAQEVAQEAYARLLQLHEPQVVGLLRAYLFKTAANIAIDRARQRITRARLDRAAWPADPVDTVTPDRRALAAEDLETVKKALTELPPNYRRAFVLHRFKDWSEEAVGNDLGVKSCMARRYIRRATIYCKLRVAGHAPDAAWRETLS